MNKLRHLAFLFLTGLPAILAVCGSIVYFSYGLNRLGSIVAGILALIVFLLLLKREYLTVNPEKSIFSKYTKQELILFALYTLTWIVSLLLLYKGRSDRPIVSPWQVVSAWYFVSYALGVALLFILAKQSSRFTLPALIMHCLLFFGTAAIVYRIGYGFDPFIHEAAVKAIQKLGQIIPLTPYYLGQYSIVAIVNTLSGFNTALFTKILVPGLAAILLPILIFRWLTQHHGKEKDWALSAIVLLILPASMFIITTPQNLGYLFLLTVIFLPSRQASSSEKILVWISAIAALVSQPIAGIPALFIALSDTIRKHRLKKTLYPIFLGLFALALPLALYTFTRLSNSGSVSLSWPNLSFLLNFLPQSPSKSDWWTNFTYLYNSLWPILLLILALSGAYLAFKRKIPELIERFAYPALALCISALITAAINFRFLIEYERSDYSERIMITALLVSVPLMIIALKEWALRIETLNRFTTIIWIVIIVSASTASLYLSYPRFDDYYNSHGYATSKADIEAVRWIEENAHGRPYVVLSNQQVSAAALREYGFKQYYNNNIFYYPIPTGGPLYSHYLAMVAKPERKEIIAAMDLSKTDLVYFVLNSYWWDYKKLAGEAAFISNETKDIGNGQVSVFVFFRK